MPDQKPESPGAGIALKARRYALWVATAAFTLFVLLPIIWMLLTALKQQGQALKFQFVPDRVARSREYVVDVGHPPSVVLEYQDAQAQQVSVTGELTGDKAIPFDRDGIRFRIELANVAPGKHRYSLIVDGRQRPDPRAGEPTPTGESVIDVVAGQTQTNGPLDVSFSQSGAADSVAIDYRADETVAAFAVVDGDRRVPLARGAEDRWSATIPGLSSGEHRIVLERERSFWVALGDIYTYRNFTEILFNDDFPFIRFFLNSLIVATVAGLITCMICTMAGYAFAKKQFPGKDAIFFMLLASMLVPGLIFMVPQFALVSKFGWINSYQGMILPHVANVFGLFLMRQYIQTIPNSLLEAARIDGANEWQVFRIAIVPLAMPIIITLFLITFVSQWSNFLWQFITNTPDSAYRTLPVGLNLFKGQYDIKWELIMAGACFSIIPVAIIFAVAQKYFIQGMTTGAVKE